MLNEVELATELQQPPVVQQPVNDSRSHFVIPEHRSPAGKLQIGVIIRRRSSYPSAIA